MAIQSTSKYVKMLQFWFTTEVKQGMGCGPDVTSNRTHDAPHFVYLLVFVGKPGKVVRKNSSHVRFRGMYVGIALDSIPFYEK